jgi:hypothetical protein
MQWKLAISVWAFAASPGLGSASKEGNGKRGLHPRFWSAIISELLAKSSALRASIYDASALNNFARLSISAALASPITK